MDTPDREPALPEPLADHLDTSPDAAHTWGALSTKERHGLARWIHQAWSEHGERERAEELFDALNGGREAVSAWTSAQQQLPSGLY